MVRYLALAVVAAVASVAPATAQSLDPAMLADEAAPQPPAGAAIGFAPPERDATGYRTPNRDLPDGEAAWHVRVALNVAALGCRGAGDEDVSEAYNALLDAERAPLARAVAATQAHYRARTGTGWEPRYDDDMTRLYNYFAQPPAHRAFCAVAAALLREARAVPAEAFAAFAEAALLRLEAPFIAFFAAYDDYRGALATWRARHRPIVIATSAPAPVGPVAVAPRGPAGPDDDR